jgi:catechol 2,3-dioxygenase-like lactoylglutathione lyase family enzyme/vacuolar-type H+-ATPase subunit H
MSEVHAHARKPGAESGDPSIETAANKLLTSVEQQARAMVEAAQSEASQIARGAEEQAAQVLGEAARKSREAQQLLDDARRRRTRKRTRELVRKRGPTLWEALNRRTKTQNGIEELRALHLAQQEELERVGATRSANAQLWVRDQNEALAFYTEMLGMELRADVTLPELGGFRWLAVGPVGQPDVAIVLIAVPGRPPAMDSERAALVRSHVAKGFEATVTLMADDCHLAYEELKDRGVEFVEEPEKSPNGIDDLSFFDPSGNQIRLIHTGEDRARPRRLRRLRRARQ